MPLPLLAPAASAVGGYIARAGIMNGIKSMAGRFAAGSLGSMAKQAATGMTISAIAHQLFGGNDDDGPAASSKQNAQAAPAAKEDSGPGMKTGMLVGAALGVGATLGYQYLSKPENRAELADKFNGMTASMDKTVQEKFGVKGETIGKLNTTNIMAGVDKAKNMVGLGDGPEADTQKVAKLDGLKPSAPKPEPKGAKPEAPAPEGPAKKASPVDAHEDVKVKSFDPDAGEVDAASFKGKGQYKVSGPEAPHQTAGMGESIGKGVKPFSSLAQGQEQIVESNLDNQAEMRPKAPKLN